MGAYHWSVRNRRRGGRLVDSGECGIDTRRAFYKAGRSWQMRFLAYRNICRNALEVVLVDERNGASSVARPVQFIFDRHEEGAVVEPTMVIPADAAESLMQALWDAGLRPNNGEGSSGQVAALKAHIAFAERVTDKILATTVKSSGGT